MHSKLSNYTHIIWDWNGTLLDDAWLCVEVMNSILAERNMKQVGLDVYRAWFDFPVKDYYQKLGFDFDQEPFEIVGTEFIVRYNRRQYESGIRPGGMELLGELHQAGYRQYILSARQHDSLVENLTHYQLAGFFDDVIGLDDHLAFGKEENGRIFMSEKRIDPATVLFVGDTLHDAMVARTMGVDVVLVAGGHQNPDRLRVNGNRVFDTLYQVRQFLLE